MQLAHVNTDKCVGHEQCHARRVCPTKALVQLDPGEIVTVVVNLCHGCGDCTFACPEGAIEIRQE